MIFITSKIRGECNLGRKEPAEKELTKKSKDKLRSHHLLLNCPIYIYGWACDGSNRLYKNVVVLSNNNLPKPTQFGRMRFTHFYVDSWVKNTTPVKMFCSQKKLLLIFS